MTANRIALKFFAEPDPGAEIDLHPFIGLFHRFIQRASVEGLLIDVADYIHVPEGPGVLLVGHEVDYGLDLSGGRTGLLTTRKRCQDEQLSALFRDLLRKSLVALQAIESADDTDLRFGRGSFALYFFDRLRMPSDDACFERTQSALAPALGELFGEGGASLARIDHDERKGLALRVDVREPIDAKALVEALGGTSGRIPDVVQQSDWDISAEELKRLREQDPGLVVVDVREPDEYEVANLGGVLVPLGSLSERLGELDPKAHTVVHCKIGLRGAKAAAILREAGFENAWNLRGGLRSWTERVDPNMKLD